MDETFLTELHELIDKYRLDEFYGIPTYLLTDLIRNNLEMTGTLLDNLSEFNHNVNEALAAAIEDEPDDSITLDGDAATALASAGFGTNEGYGGTDERL